MRHFRFAYHSMFISLLSEGRAGRIRFFVALSIEKGAVAVLPREGLRPYVLVREGLVVLAVVAVVRKMRINVVRGEKTNDRKCAV